MPDNICAGACGNAVSSLNSCKNCLKYVHPGCISKHKCQSATDDTILQCIKQLQTTIDTMRTSMTRELKEIRDENAELKLILNEVRALRDENSKLKQDINELNNKIDILSSQNTGGINESDFINRTINEINDRNWRQNNILIFNMPESQSNEVAEDLRKIRDKFNIIKPNITIKKTIRLGKKSEKPRPLKVVLDSPSDATLILKNRKKFEPENKIKPDWTPIQQQYVRNVYQELQTRTENGETDLGIIYRNNIPKIVSDYRKNISTANLSRKN